MEGRLFSRWASPTSSRCWPALLVSVTVTPVLCFYLLPRMKSLDHGDTRLLAWLKRATRRGAAGGAAAAAGRARRWAARRCCGAARPVPFFPRTFLPPFNEGTLLIGLRLNPGTSLAESARARRARPRVLVEQVPEVTHVGRRTRPRRARRTRRGRARRRDRRGPEAAARADAQRWTRSWPTSASGWSTLPAALDIGQPISHRLDHLLSGVRAQIAIKIFGDDLDTLRGQADAMRGQLAAMPGLADLRDREAGADAADQGARRPSQRAAQYGVPAPQAAGARCRA